MSGLRRRLAQGRLHGILSWRTAKLSSVLINNITNLPKHDLCYPGALRSGEVSPTAFGSNEPVRAAGQKRGIQNLPRADAYSNPAGAGTQVSWTDAKRQEVSGKEARHNDVLVLPCPLLNNGSILDEIRFLTQATWGVGSRGREPRTGERRCERINKDRLCCFLPSSCSLPLLGLAGQGRACHGRRHNYHSARGKK
jgi:hypothetical protein